MMPLCSIGQIHTSLDAVASYDFINRNIISFTPNKPLSKSYRFGANFNFRIFDKQYIKTGIRYVKQGDVYFVSFTAPSPLTYYYDEYYIEVPVVSRSEFGKKKLSPFIEVGLAPLLFLKAKRLVNNSGNIIEKEDVPPYLEDKRIRMSIVISLGCQYKLNKHFLLFVQPTYRYLFPLEYNSGLTLKGRNFGIEFGVRKALSFDQESN